MWFGLGAVIVLIGLFAYPTTSEADIDVSDLPVWFDRAHRIERPVTAATPVSFVPGVGMLLPPREANAAETLPRDAFERDFTHYTKIPLFVWSTPEHVYPSHGKIFRGTKVIFGKEVNGMVLVCLRTNDGKPMNMFIEKGYLIDRTQGPPKGRDD
jgi:hypothetical protein